jgi:hypothetical protein
MSIRIDNEGHVDPQPLEGLPGDAVISFAASSTTGPVDCTVRYNLTGTRLTFIRDGTRKKQFTVDGVSIASGTFVEEPVTIDSAGGNPSGAQTLRITVEPPTGVRKRTSALVFLP